MTQLRQVSVSPSAEGQQETLTLATNGGRDVLLSPPPPLEDEDTEAER